MIPEEIKKHHEHSEEAVNIPERTRIALMMHCGLAIIGIVFALVSAMPQYVISNLFALFLIYKAWHGRNWARIFIIVQNVIGIVINVAVAMSIGHDAAAALFLIFIIVLGAGVIYLLLSRESSAWYALMKQAKQANP